MLSPFASLRVNSTKHLLLRAEIKSSTSLAAFALGAANRLRTSVGLPPVYALRWPGASQAGRWRGPAVRDRQRGRG